MSDLFKEKKARVVVVDQNGPVRQLMSESIRGLGFEDVSSQGSIVDLLHYLETEEAEWCVVGLLQDQPANALHLLKIISENASLKNMRVTLCVEEDERYVLPKAFEYGLMSVLMKPFTKESLPEDLNSLMSVMEENDWDDTLVSAHFLRQAIEKDDDINPADLVKFEESLVETYPGNPKLLIQLARAYHQSEETDKARGILSQVHVIYPDLAEAVETMAKELFGAEGLGEVNASTAFNTLGIQNVVIIDNDDTNCAAVKEVFEEMGAVNIQSFSDGDSAWEWLDSNEEPDIIIQEWRIPKISGPMLVQRIRAKGFYKVPVIVLSSLIKPEDMPLAREMGISTICGKPLQKESFMASVIWTIQQERMPSETQSIERKIRAALLAKDKAGAESFIAEFLSNDKIPVARKRTIEAEVAFHDKDYLVARKAGIEALKNAGDSVILLNLLGKTFMCLNDYEGALRCFQKANDMSPNNIERLCNIAESQMEVGEEEAAKETLDDAGVLDPDNDQVNEAKVKVALAGGDTDAAKKMMGHLESLSGIISYMNNKAVAHAKCGFANEAIEIYDKVITSIPDENADIRTIVRYNMALGLVRDSNFEKAVEILGEVIKDEKNKVFKKATSLKKRLDKAIEKGEALELRAAEPSKEAQTLAQEKSEGAQNGEAEDKTVLNSQADYAKMMAMVEAKRGDLCCYLIFVSNNDDDSIDQLLEKQPRFARRDAIERDESFGAEMSNKSA